MTTARCTCTLTSARLTSTVMTPPVTPPRLHSPCSRFITGVRRRELSTDPCTFIATSMKTSKNSRPIRPTTSIAGAVANPTIGSDPIDMIVPMITTRRVPSLAITRPVSRLPTRPEMLASVRTSPSAPIEMPTRSRISGSSGMNDA